MMAQRIAFLSTIASVIPQLIETQNQILYFTWQV
jgi:hypothetical protein